MQTNRPTDCYSAHCELILGGARSGKSALAQKKATDFEAADSGSPPLATTYLATATPGDEEMASRISHHQQCRPAHWMTLEEPILLTESIASVDAPGSIILVDCLTLWITNLLCSNNPELLEREKNKLLAYIPQLKGKLILVSNETGLGIIPMDKLSRQFVDEAGWLHQQIAKLADTVTYCVAGLEQTLKSSRA